MTASFAQPVEAAVSHPGCCESVFFTRDFRAAWRTVVLILFFVGNNTAMIRFCLDPGWPGRYDGELLTSLNNCLDPRQTRPSARRFGGTHGSQLLAFDQLPACLGSDSNVGMTN